MEWMARLDTLWTTSSHPAWRIIAIWLAALLVLRFMRRLVAAARVQVAVRAPEHAGKRIDTLSNVFEHTTTVVTIAIACMLTFDQFGISIAPLLATAGVAGIAIGFGAQSLVKDFFTGLFLLLENQLAEGEFVELAGKSGIVEEITLRHIRLRDQDGSVHFVPNGIVTIVTNRSRS
jgi:small conductance mechanosensitive channel